MPLLDCTVIGDVFVDIPAKIKSNPQDFFLGGISYCDFAKPVLGGSGNVAVGISKLGGQAAFIGKAGNDVFGKLYAQDLKKNGVSSEVFVDKSLPTGLIFVLIHERERSFLVSRGANDHLLSYEIKKSENFLKESKFVYFCGYSIVQNPQRNSILEAVEISKKSGAKIVFDPGAYNIIQPNRDFFMSLLDLCDVISLNIDEAKAMSHKTNLKDIVSDIGKKVQLTVLKCGENGSLAYERGKYSRTRGYNVNAIDSTGAGDAFGAALIYGLAHQLPLELTTRLANWFAAQVTRKIGSRSFPSKSMIQGFLGY